MKITLYLFILFFPIIYSTTLNAQENIGIEIAMPFSKFDVKNKSAEPKFKLGMKFGFYYVSKLSKHFEIESGLFYIQKGDKYKSYHKSGTLFSEEPLETNTVRMYRLNYIHLPVSFRFTYDNLFVSGGVYISSGFDHKFIEKRETRNYETGDLLFKSEEITYLLNIDEYNQSTFNGHQTAKKYDYGLVFGIGYKYKRFVVKSNLELGLRGIIENTSPYIFGFDTETKEYKNKTYSISLIYLITNN